VNIAPREGRARLPEVVSIFQGVATTQRNPHSARTERGSAESAEDLGSPDNPRSFPRYGVRLAELNMAAGSRAAVQQSLDSETASGVTMRVGSEGRQSCSFLYCEHLAIDHTIIALACSTSNHDLRHGSTIYVDLSHFPWCDPRPHFLGSSL
jgi:hypothetical protein